MLLTTLLLLLTATFPATKAAPSTPSFTISPPDSNTTIANSTSLYRRDIATDHPITTCKSNHLPPLHWYFSAVGDACANLWTNTPLTKSLTVTVAAAQHWDQEIPTYDNSGLTFRFKVYAALERNHLDPPRYFSYSDCLANFGYTDNVGILTGAGMTKCYASEDAADGSGKKGDVLVRGGSVTYYPAPIGSRFVFHVAQV
ncbi:uncharacterized protein BDZ99DRAFT_469021 [Mytilinidion resinicola]|uniref:Ubiquitin 3 binding protein But2 C-terminal domain-containing protein n=1 Tax=Mytilinidion resinicola TaxID=574789 RepID=A0A6A6Y150_9PEZI|nr:uncharacterized protein BDZ99DRAFT_469021 [Mytilinidion resinicola]KAF2802243.1 hypothetical protein BDZ99DRAFT_469021 [Mytilinidion resinicola]